MAEPIGIASGLVALTIFAFKSSVALHDTINSYQSHQQRVRDLVEETGALSGVLSSLAETVRATGDLDLSALELPLRRCGKACQEFEQEIKKCAPRSDGSIAQFRGWARLRYMGDDIDGFRHLLAGYKMTITIALTDANLRRSHVTTESIEGYNELLDTARADLEDRLERIDEKLDAMLMQSTVGSKSDESELKQIEEERLSTEKCLQVCAQLSAHISQIQLAAARSVGPGDSNYPNSVPAKITNDGLEECKESLARMAAKLAGHEKLLFGRLADKMNSVGTSAADLTDFARLRDEWESTRQSMDILSAAGKHLEKNTSIIENHATGDAVQIMVSTNGKTLHGTNRGLGWRSRQVGGYLSDQTVRQISRDMSSIPTRYTHKDEPSTSCEEGNALGTVSEKRRRAEFTKRYGDGIQLEAKSPSDRSTHSSGR